MGVGETKSRGTFRLRTFALTTGAALLFAWSTAAGASAAKHKIRVESQSHATVTATTPAWLQLNIHGSFGTYAESDCHIEAPGSFLNNEANKVVFQGTEEFVDTECTGGSLVGSPGQIKMTFSAGLLTLTHMKIVLNAEGCVYELTTKLKLELAFPETEATQGVEIKTKLNRKQSHPTEERECPIPSPHAGEEGPEVRLAEVGVSEEEEPFPANAFLISSA
jgi:hypothetical protein